MLRLLKFLFTGDPHLHKWVLIEKRDVMDGDYSKIPVGQKYICQCEHCGKIKVFKTYSDW